MAEEVMKEEMKKLEDLDQNTEWKVDFDEWKASGFSTVVLLPPSERADFQKSQDRLREWSIQNPESVIAKAWRLSKDLESQNVTILRAITSDGWRPAAARKRVDRS